MSASAASCLAQDEARAQRVARVEHEAVLAGAEGRSLHLGRAGPPGASPRARAWKRVPTIESLRQVWPSASPPSAASSARCGLRWPTRWASDRPRRRRRSRRCADAAGRAARRGPCRRCRRRSSPGWRATSLPSRARFTARPAAISAGRSSGHHPQAEALRGGEGVERTAEGHVDRHVAGRHVARDHVCRHVAKRDALHGAAGAAHSGRHPPGGHVDRHVQLAVRGRLYAARLDRPGSERDRAVAARRRVAVLVPEQHPELGAVVVGGHEKAAVHVGVAARLVAQQAADSASSSSEPAACSRRSATVAPGIAGTPLRTIRNGSPAVW